MFRRLTRSVPALGAVLAVGLLGVGSFAVAGERKAGPWHSGGHGYGHHHGSCHGKRVSGLDERWLKLYIETNLFEIAGGQAALEKSANPEVRALATHLVEDHTAALARATALAERLRVEVPTTPSPLQQWALRAASSFEGPAFDRWFADLQVEGHRQAIMETETELARGCNRKVRRLAAMSLPVLEEHLEHARMVLDSVDD